ncbi:MAG: hypothetical protein ACFFCQ_15650 [Promethearchaeota archaeon]
MPELEVKPKPKVSFFLKNIGTIIKIKRANRKKIEKFISSTPYLNQPLMPSFEGTGGPMEEGMIYLMFNSQDGTSSSIDSVFRVFWVNAPDLRFAFFDSFLISENLKMGQWERSYSEGIFKNRSKSRFHQEVSLEEFSMTCDGIWSEGYHFVFEDKLNEISGEVNLTPLSPEGVIVYYGGRIGVTPSMAQKAYDLFALRVTGDIIVPGGKKIQVKDGRAIIEHGLGVFSNFHIYDWRWLDLQFPEGSLHLFYLSVDLREEGEGIVISGEGAAVINGKWYHFPPGTFEISEVKYEADENLPTKVPVEWRVRTWKDSPEDSLFDLNVKKTFHHSWVGAMGRENEFITNYILEARGVMEGKDIEGKGTMENQMHRIIE